jgi:hypothetical protein
MANIRNTSVTRPDRILSAGERNRSVQAKIDNHFKFGVEAMHVPRRVVHGVNREAYAVKAERSHLFPE